MNFILRHVRNKMVIGNSHHGFARGRLCLTSLISLPFVEEERAESVLFPVLGKDFYTVLHSILTASLERDRMDG